MATIGRLTLSRLLLTTLSRPSTRAPVTNRVRSVHSYTGNTWQQYGVPGATLPFSLTNRYKLTLYFILYFGVPFNLPFIVVALQLMKH